MTTSPFASLVQQILDAPHEQERAWPLNPFPRGPRPGCATERIMLALLDAHPRWLEAYELRLIAECKRGALAWGVRYLAERGRIRSIPSFRHPGYCRYQAVMNDGEEGDAL